MARVIARQNLQDQQMIPIQGIKPADYFRRISRELQQSLFAARKGEIIDAAGTTDRIGCPLTTDRLKPMYERVDRTRYSITDSGIVRLQLVRSRNNNNVISETFEISSNGKQITIIQSQEITHEGHVVFDHQAGDMEAEYSVRRKTYTLEELPQKYFHKYHSAKKFVNLVKSVTPKIVFQTKKATCMLMENKSSPCFIARFQNGQTYVNTSRGIKVLDSEHSNILPVTSSNIYQHTDDIQKLVRFAQKCHKECLKVNRYLNSSSELNIQYPLIIPSSQTNKRNKFTTDNGPYGLDLIYVDDEI